MMNIDEYKNSIENDELVVFYGHKVNTQNIEKSNVIENH